MYVRVRDKSWCFWRSYFYVFRRRLSLSLYFINLSGSMDEEGGGGHGRRAIDRSCMIDYCPESNDFATMFNPRYNYIR